MVATVANQWVDTQEGDHPEVIAKARNILAQVHYCTLATCSPEGIPWASPVFFAYDSDWHLYWSSATASQHSQNLYGNQGRCAIAIYASDRAEGQGQGLYLAGTAGELDPAAIPETMTLLFQRAGNWPQRTPADYLGDSPRRIYHFRPHTVWVTGERLAIGSQLIDTKVQLDLALLQGNAP